MIAPTDDDYRDTKRVKTQGTPLPPPFKELAEWIAARYDVHVLNVILDTIEPDNLPRLNVILEWAGEERKFMEDSFPNFDAPKQREIRDKFASLASDHAITTINMARLLVVFSSFEPVARTEANWRVTAHEIEQLKKTLNNRDLWEVRRGFETVTFFFYTDAQVKVNETCRTRERFAQAYAQLTAAYDEFGYLAKRGITVCLDSKENFDSATKATGSTTTKTIDIGRVARTKNPEMIAGAPSRRVCVWGFRPCLFLLGSHLPKPFNLPRHHSTLNFDHSM